MKNDAPQIPEALAERLTQYGQAEKREHFRRAGHRILLMWLVAFVLVFLSDRFWDTPMVPRALLWLGGIAASLGAVGSCIWNWVLNPPGPDGLARRIRRHDRRAGDRFLGAVELGMASSWPEGMSPALCRAALRQAGEACLSFNFLGAVDHQRTDRLRAIWLRVAVVVGLFLVLAPAAFPSVLVRLAWPWGATPRFTLVDVALASAVEHVPRGESWLLRGTVDYRSFWKPSQLRIRAGGREVEIHVVEEGRFEMEMPGQVADTRLDLLLGDARTSVEVQARPRPSIVSLQAEVQAPEYLGTGVVTQEVRTASLAVLSGSTVRLNGRVNQSIRSASWLGDGDWNSLSTTGEAFRTPEIFPPLEQVSFSWLGNSGFSNKEPWKLYLEWKEDQPPRISVSGAPLQGAILETDLLTVELTGDDDYGLAGIGIQLAWKGDKEQGDRSVFFDNEQAGATRQSESYLLSPLMLNAPPGSVIELTGTALDRLPGREPSVSRTSRLLVVGLVEHAEKLREALEGVFAQVEEVTRTQEALKESTETLRDLGEDALKGDASAQAQKQAAEQALAQKQAAQDLAKLAEEAGELLQEAVKNPSISEELLAQWARNAREMSELPKGAMQQAQQSLGKAAAQPEERWPSLEDALEAEEKALEQLQAMQQRMNEGLDEMEAQTLAQRLRQVGGEEDNLFQSLRRTIAETVGLRRQELSVDHLKQLNQVTNRQGEVTLDADKIREEIGRFFDRTQREAYGKVADSMKEKDMVVSLNKMTESMGANLSLRSMKDLSDWGNLFQEWADQLMPPKKDSSGGGGGGGGGGENEEDHLMKQLLTLVRVRKEEWNLRQQTGAMDQVATRDEGWKESVGKLAGHQEDLGRTLGELATDNEEEMLHQAYTEARLSMQDVLEKLQGAETGEATEQSQLRSIAHLTDLINLINENAQQQQNNSSQSQGAQQDMQFLLQLVQQAGQPQAGQQAGQTPGQGMRNGGQGMAGAGPGGEAEGGAPGSRRVEKSNSRSWDVPPAWQSSMSRFFKAMEGRDAN